MEERLNKWLSRMGVCSRREADRLIQEGKVLIDGKVAQMGQRVEDGQKVICDGKPVGDTDGGRGEVKPPRPVLLAVNKPRGIVCTTSDKDRAENIVEMLSYPERIYPIGRLDKESEGLILMTNQGDLVNKIMRSTNAHEKEYIVTVDKVLTDEFIKQMSEGVWLEELERKTPQTGRTSFFDYPDPGLKPADPANVPGLRIPGTSSSQGAHYEYPVRRFENRRIS